MIISFCFSTRRCAQPHLAQRSTKYPLYLADLVTRLRKKSPHSTKLADDAEPNPCAKGHGRRHRARPYYIRPGVGARQYRRGSCPCDLHRANCRLPWHATLSCAELAAGERVPECAASVFSPIREYGIGLLSGLAPILAGLLGRPMCKIEAVLEEERVGPPRAQHVRFAAT